jgi:hypothetical protein
LTAGSALGILLIAGLSISHEAPVIVTASDEIVGSGSAEVSLAEASLAAEASLSAALEAS